MITLKKLGWLLWRSYQFLCTFFITLYLFLAFMIATHEIRLPNGFFLSPDFSYKNFSLQWFIHGNNHIRLLDKNRNVVVAPRITYFYWSDDAVYGWGYFNGENKESCFIATTKGDLWMLPECKGRREKRGCLASSRSKLLL